MRSCRLPAPGDGIAAAEMSAIFQRFCEAEYRNDVDARRREFGADAESHRLGRTARQRSFDALRTMFRTAAAAENVGTVSDPLVNIVVDASTWGEPLAASGLTPAGIALHPHDVLRAALAGHVRRVIVDSNSVVVDMGRRQRLFTGAAREAARPLLIYCEHPGCELSAELCDIDHSIEWKDGGPTDQANSGPECSSHNIAKTRRKWQKRRALDGRNYTIRQDGTVILSVGVRPPTFPTNDNSDEDDDHTPAEITQLEQVARTRAAALTPPDRRRPKHAVLERHMGDAHSTQTVRCYGLLSTDRNAGSRAGRWLTVRALISIGVEVRCSLDDRSRPERRCHELMERFVRQATALGASS